MNASLAQWTHDTPQMSHNISWITVSFRELHGYGTPAAGHGSGYHTVWVWVWHVGTHTLTCALGWVFPDMVGHSNHSLTHQCPCPLSSSPLPLTQQQQHQ